MIDMVARVRAAYRWYWTYLYTLVGPAYGTHTGRACASYACSIVFYKAVLGRPTAYGPHQAALAAISDDLTRNHQVKADWPLAKINPSSQRLLPLEAELLCMSLGMLYTLAQAADITAVSRLSFQDSIREYNPLADEWMDGWTHGPEEQLIHGTLHRIELLMDDPDSPGADWVRVGREYADGELHRHLGAAQEAMAREAEGHGEQAAEIRDRGVPDQPGTDDQVAGQRADRSPVPREGARAGAHHPDHHDD